MYAMQDTKFHIFSCAWCDISHAHTLPQVPVVYDVVSKLIPKLIEEVKPQLCVHVGVSPYKEVKLEKCGKNFPYFMADVNGKAPPEFKCVPNGPESIETRFNVEKICEKVSKKHSDVEFGVSTDAGRYLCDFIYYTSLSINSAPVLFVHIPELDKPYNSHQLASALKTIIETLLEEMSNHGK